MAQRRVAGRARWPLGSLVVSALALAALLVLVRPAGSSNSLLGGGAGGTATAGPTSTPVPAETQSARPAPSGGISENKAVSIAQKAAPLSAVFVSAEAGPLASVFDDPHVAAGLPIEGDHEVWVVRFNATAAPCPPGGSTCESPRPGTVTVVLDYVSGQVFVTDGLYPEP
jgi:hypothetical protein